VSIITDSDRGISLDAPDPWWHRAACLDYDPELFFPRASAVRVDSLTRTAIPDVLRWPLRICLDCPVRAECLTDAVTTTQTMTAGWGRGGTLHGVRGGVFWSDAGRPGDPFGFLAAEMRARKAVS